MIEALFALGLLVGLAVLTALVSRWLRDGDYLGHAVDCRCRDCRLIRELRRERAP